MYKDCSPVGEALNATHVIKLVLNTAKKKEDKSGLRDCARLKSVSPNGEK